MNRRAGVGGWIIFLLFLIVAIVLFVFFQLSAKPDPVPLNSSNFTNYSYFDVWLYSNAASVVNFEVYNSSGLIGSGKLLPGVPGLFKGVRENSSINFSVWSEEYYFNVSECYIPVNNSRCGVVVDRKALEFNVSLFSDYLQFRDVRGVVRLPIVCFL